LICCEFGHVGSPKTLAMMASTASSSLAISRMALR
jgi:hypothetical protein